MHSNQEVILRGRVRGRCIGTLNRSSACDDITHQMLMLGTVFPPVVGMWTVIFGANVLVEYIVPILLSWTINSKYSLSWLWGRC